MCVCVRVYVCVCVLVYVLLCVGVCWFMCLLVCNKPNDYDINDSMKNTPSAENRQTDREQRRYNAPEIHFE